MTLDPTAAARWPRLLAIAASGVLLALYARGGAGWALGFVVLVPWLLALDATRNLRGSLLSGVLMSLVFVAAVFTWFGTAIGSYTGVGAVTATTALVLLSPLMQPQLIGFALVRHLVGRQHGPVLSALAAASAWVAIEAMAPKLLGDTLGHGLYPSATLRQVADLGGTAGLTLLLLLVNEGIALAIRRRRDGMRALMPPALACVAIVAGMAVYGALRLDALKTPPTEDAATLRVAMVQASITDYEERRRALGAYEVVRHVLDTHYALSFSALRDHQADVLLWSETVYPTTFGSPRSEDGAALDREIQGLVDATGVPLLFGTYDLDAEGEYNAAVLLEPGRGRLATYRKTHPFPLTESVPAWLDGPLLRQVLPWAGAWKAGDGARVVPLRSADGREVNVQPLICLDDVSTTLAIDGARLGAQALIGLSNDSWFTDEPIGARLHLAVAAFRSVETRLPQLRVTTNGLSAVVDDTGEILASTAMGQQAVLTGFISARDPAPTLMVRWGDWVGRAGGVFLLALGIFHLWRRWRGAAVMGTDAPTRFVVHRFPPGLRALIAALRLAALAGLAWIAYDMATRFGWQVQSLVQLQAFAIAVVGPLLIAWGVSRMREANASVDGGLLVLDTPRERIEIALGSITAVTPWRLPVPGAGLQLTLASGQRWSLGAARALALQHALVAAGAAVSPSNPRASFLATLAELRGVAAHALLDHPALKFGLFPLLPALVAFRLHQIIAFGGFLGEWQTYGPLAWSIGLALWWGSWSIGMMLFAAALRGLIESANVTALALRPAHALAVRDASEWLGRLAYYVGVPALLVLRLLASA